MPTISSHIERAAKDVMTSGQVQLRLGVVVERNDDTGLYGTSQLMHTANRINVRMYDENGIASLTTTPCHLAPGVDLTKFGTDRTGWFSGLFGEIAPVVTQLTVLVACIGKGRGAESSVVLCVVDPSYTPAINAQPAQTAPTTTATALPPAG